MREKLNAALNKVAEAIRATKALRSLARTRRSAKIRKRNRLNDAADELWAKARKWRKEGHLQKAEYFQSQAQEKGRRADKAEAGAARQTDRIRRLTIKIEHLEEAQAEIEREMKAFIAEHKIRIDGQKVVGGTRQQRIKVAGDHACVVCAKGERHPYYSQAGAYNVHVPFSGPVYGHDRSDCSSEVTSWFWSAGANDPNKCSYGSGYTGTLTSGALREVSQQEARNRPDALCIWGPKNATHHVEKMRGNGTGQTQGHGSTAVDIGSDTMLSGEKHYYVYA